MEKKLFVCSQSQDSASVINTNTACGTGRHRGLENAGGKCDDNADVLGGAWERDMSLHVAKASEAVRNGDTSPENLFFSVYPLIVSKCREEVKGKIISQELYEEYRSACMEVVYKAALTYRADGGAKFSTYAFTAIKNAVIASRLSFTNSDRNETAVLDSKNEIEAEIIEEGDLVDDKGKIIPMDVLIKNRLGANGVSISLSKINKILRREDLFSVKDGKDITLGERVEGSLTDTEFDEGPGMDELRRALTKVCKGKADQVEKMVLFLVEGLDYKEIGAMYGVTGQAIGHTVRAVIKAIGKAHGTYAGRVISEAYWAGYFCECILFKNKRFGHNPAA